VRGHRFFEVDVVYDFLLSGVENNEVMRPGAEKDQLAGSVPCASEFCGQQKCETRKDKAET